MKQIGTHLAGARPRVMLAAAALVALAVSALSLNLGVDPASSSKQLGKSCGLAGKGKKRQRIATSKLIVEYNATDKDIGVHGAFDDHGWSRLCIYDPTGREILRVGPKSQLKDLTMAGIFFESREPPIGQFSFREMKRKFPEGRYRVRGLTFDGKRLFGSAKFTHDVPRRPIVTAPADGATVDPSNLTVSWNDVTQTVEGKPVNMSGYEVIVTKEQDDDPHGFSRPTYDVHVPPDRNSLSVPAEFLQPGSEYELEVLALEKSGNQTISVSFFKTP